LPPGRYVRINVQDQGMGIRPEHLLRIFEPYFSTKQRGSGLGLATAYSIIKRHDGLIQVESELGVGTTFKIYLPASNEALNSAAESHSMPTPGQGRILIMDDEPLILTVATMILKRLGYDVETVDDGDAAIQKYRDAMESGKPFAAVIMDLTVPGGTGGKEAIKKLLAIDPHAKAIVSSGYFNDPVMANFREHGFSDVITKPYQSSDLAKVLDKVLRQQNG